MLFVGYIVGFMLSGFLEISGFVSDFGFRFGFCDVYWFWVGIV